MTDDPVNWRPSASMATLQKRAAVMAHIRTFFNERAYLEVETPVMARYAVTDLYLENIAAQFQNKPYFLQTSPEYHMKRLLAAGSGPVFQLARVFRDDELGRWHNPEFTMLEWYQLDIDHHGLMDEVDTFLRGILSCAAMQRITYRQAFINACDLDPFRADLNDLRRLLKKYQLQNVLPADEDDRDQYLFLLMSHAVEPYLAGFAGPVAVYDFPASQAALAQVRKGLAERFEVYFKGVELANGFHELTDAAAQADRFKQDVKARQQKGLVKREADQYFLAAIRHGLPACSGVALGIDRLLALLLDKTAISGTMAFDISRA